MVRSIILTVMALTFAFGARADVGWYINKGRAPEPTAEGGEPDIRMAAEAVDIILHDDGVEVFGTFEFVNDSDEARTVEMYFPLNVGTLELTPETAGATAGTDFYGEELTADGVTAKFGLSVDGSDAPYELTDIYYDTDGEASELTANAVWAIGFAPGEAKTAECGYFCGYGSEREFFYVVYTGGAWKGPIGEGRITIHPCRHFDWERPALFRAVEMPPIDVYDDRIEWVFADFEPTEPEYESYTSLGDGSGIEIIIPWPDALPEEMAAEYEGPIASIGDEDVLLYEELPRREGDPIVVTEIPSDSLVTLLKRKGAWFYAKYNPTGAPDDGVEGWFPWYKYDPVSGKDTYTIAYVSVF
ncbi:MAG: hypothetical protein JSW52_12545 [Candidatus Coatesbacteria bacterium]|nr:MAG: hypothetical protein JSW52_12545 [Candidatus Coatesbacteria bacterium]